MSSWRRSEEWVYPCTVNFVQRRVGDCVTLKYATLDERWLSTESNRQAGMKTSLHPLPCAYAGPKPAKLVFPCSLPEGWRFVPGDNCRPISPSCAYGTGVQASVASPCFQGFFPVFSIGSHCLGKPRPSLYLLTIPHVCSFVKVL